MFEKLLKYGKIVPQYSLKVKSKIEKRVRRKSKEPRRNQLLLLLYFYLFKKSGYRTRPKSGRLLDKTNYSRSFLTNYMLICWLHGELQNKLIICYKITFNLIILWNISFLIWHIYGMLVSERSLSHIFEICGRNVFELTSTSQEQKLLNLV